MSDRVREFGDFAVGQRYVTATYEMTEAEILAFAREWDPQPLHLDHDAATDGLLDGLSASGWHTASVSMRLQVHGPMWVAGGIVGAGGEIAWPAPTRPGDVLRVESEVLEVRASRSNPHLGIVSVMAETKNQDDVVVQTFRVTMFVPREEPDGV